MLFLSLLYFLWIQCVTATVNWPGLSEQRVLAIRSQRDVSANITIDQLSLNGVRLSKVLFDRKGYTNDTLIEVRELLNIGIQTLVIDVYWNENLQEFQLCPVDLSNNSTTSGTNFDGVNILYYEKDQKSYKCDDVLSLQGLIRLVSIFGQATDTNLSANLIMLIFNIHSLSSKNTYFSQNNNGSNNTISSILSDNLGSKLYKPSDLEHDRSANNTLLSGEGSGHGFPSSSYFLFSEEKRYIATIWENELPSNSTYNIKNDYDAIFTKTALNSSFTSLENTTTPTSQESFINKSFQNWRFAYDEPANPFNNATVKRLVNEGYSPILNAPVSRTMDIATIFNTSLWSWNSTQPLKAAQAKELSPDYGNTRNTESAYKCAAITEEGWVVSNCYQEKYVVCRKNSRAFEWKLSNDKKIYFHAIDACPEDTTFSVPRDALQEASLMDYLTSLGSNYSVWIDMNSIAISDCWVTGGPYASCPYQKVSNERNFVEMLTPAAAFCLIIFIAILLLRLKRVPVQDNRKHWKKTLATYTDNEYEGVPS